MTVAELIKKLETLNPERNVMIEVNQGEVVNIVENDVEEMRLNEWGSIAFEDEDGDEVVVIKAQRSTVKCKKIFFEL